MNFTEIALFYNLSPSTSKQTPQLSKNGFVANRILQSSAFDWCPTLWH
jgi:hypothetical protein